MNIFVIVIASLSNDHITQPPPPPPKQEKTKIMLTTNYDG